MSPEVFQQLVSAVVLAIVSLLAFAARGLITVGITFLRQKIGATNFDLLKGLAKTVVSFLAQSPAFENLANDEKKQRALAEIQAFCEDHNLPVDHELIDKLIEEAVLEIKKDIPPSLFEATAEPVGGK